VLPKLLQSLRSHLDDIVAPFEQAESMHAALLDLLPQLIIPNCQMSPKFLKLLKKGYENASQGSLAHPPLASICA